MKVGLIGYFGSDAYSDDLIEYVTKKLFLDVNPDIKFDSLLLQNCTDGTNVDYLNSFDLIVHAGGSLLGKCTHYPIHDISAWMKRVTTPLAIFGPGYRYEPDKEPLSPIRRRRLHLLFEKAEVISVRGCQTIKHLEANGIDISKIDSVGDPVTACDIRLKREPKYIMGNVRLMPTEEIQHAPTAKVHTLMAKIYDWLIEEYDLPLRLVSFRHNLPNDNDLKGAKKVQAEMIHGDKSMSLVYPYFKNAIDCMKDAVFWFGQRLHPTVFAAINGIPFVGVEYQFDKMKDWASTVGINNYIKTDNATLEDFINSFQRTEQSFKRLNKALPNHVAEIKDTAKKIMDLV